MLDQVNLQLSTKFKLESRYLLSNDCQYNFTNNKFYNGSITGGDNGTGIVKLGGTMEIPYNTFITNWQNGPRSESNALTSVDSLNGLAKKL